MISSDSAEEKETALRNLWFKTKGKAEHDMEYSFRQVLDKIGIEYLNGYECKSLEFVEICCGSCCYYRSIMTATLWISYNHFDRDNIAMGGTLCE